MELPHIGESCSITECSRLDFLPYKCDLCSRIFCQDHRIYENHDCPERYKVDAQVPVCPKCGDIIPMKPGEDPNFKVNSHIENNCRKTPKVKAYSNKCNKRGCKKKEAIPVQCTNCKQNFCLAHRFEQDHDCQGFVHPLARNSRPAPAPVRAPARTAPAPAPSRVPARTAPVSVPQRSEPPSTEGDEELARRLAEEEDEALARALQASLVEERYAAGRTNNRQATQRQDSNSSCAIS